MGENFAYAYAALHMLTLHVALAVHVSGYRGLRIACNKHRGD